jgi:ligand-binding sensor protein
LLFILHQIKHTKIIKLAEIINIEILQKIQNGFSDAFELPAIIYDNKGQPITKSSKFTEFYNIVRSTAKAYQHN